MVATAQKLQWNVLESELEALFIEAELIRTHQPQFNTLLKDDKTPLYIVITDEVYPRVLTARKKELHRMAPKATILGPFSSAYKVREVLRIVREIFPWCSGTRDGKACFYYHLRLCPGACVGKITPEEYRQNIDQLILFLRGQKKDVIRQVEKAMQAEAEKENYEKAALLRDRLNLIQTVTEKKYSLKPDLVLPALKASAAEEGIVQLRRILAMYLNISHTYPLHRIEAYDVSNIQGTNATVAMVTAVDGQPDPSEYKLFNVRTLNTPNDFWMLREAILRRQNHSEWGQPDLVVIDGGKGQLRAVQTVWQWPCPVISIAKDPDRLVIPITKQYQVLPKADPKDSPTKIQKYQIVKLSSDHPALRIIQQLRDEAHRFSKKQHTRLRTRQMFQ